MTHCVEFWRKWKKEPNFCGMGGSSAKTYDQYLSFVAETAFKHGIDEDLIYRNVPYTAVKSLLKFKKESKIRKEAVEKIVETLQNKHAVTGKFVDHVIGVAPATRSIKPSPPQIQRTKEVAEEAFKTDKVRDKVRMINSILTSGQREIVIDIMQRTGLDNEYEAICLAIVWAKERLDTGAVTAS